MGNVLPRRGQRTATRLVCGAAVLQVITAARVTPVRLAASFGELESVEERFGRAQAERRHERAVIGLQHLVVRH